MNEDPHRIVRNAAGVEAVHQFQEKNATASSTPLQSPKSVDDVACQFLQLILPEKGVYALFVVEGTRKHVGFASTIPELWQTIKAADAAGHTVYHACAAYKEPRHDPRGTPPRDRRYGRTKRNARSAKSLWLDVDAGLDKPYADWKAATRAVAEFCKATGLPRPLIVLSGLGLHVYWPLLEALDPKRWHHYARGLRALCVKHNLKIDPARTADITSVLRTPGTHHQKSGLRLVRCSPLIGPYALEQFAALLAVEPAVRKTNTNNWIIDKDFGPLPLHLDSRPFESVSEPLNRSLSTTFNPSFAELIVEHCEQIRALRDSGGELPEPLWYACLGVLAFAEDGEKLAHEWSRGDPRYTWNETQERLDRARQLSGATTCRRFHDLNPQVCDRCKFWSSK
jgi:putative DNA primase/helicase